MTQQQEHIFDLTGKFAIVTGANGTLGRNFCQALASHGCVVAGVDLPNTRKAFDKNQPESTNFEGIYDYECDITSEREVEYIVSKIEKDFGKLDILHNNAATKSESIEDFFLPFEQYSLKTWREVMSVNIDGMFLMAQAVGKRMVKQGTKGSIIQTSSIYGMVGPHKDIYKGSNYLGSEISTPAVYSTSKAAVIGLTKYLSSYWGNRNIRVNCLIPGGIASGQNELFDQLYSELVPLHRMGTKSELEAALVFLASDASSYITGQNIVVDGGFTIW